MPDTALVRAQGSHRIDIYRSGRSASFRATRRSAVIRTSGSPPSSSRRTSARFAMRSATAPLAISPSPAANVSLIRPMPTNHGKPPAPGPNQSQTPESTPTTAPPHSSAFPIRRIGSIRERGHGGARLGSVQSITSRLPLREIHQSRCGGEGDEQATNHANGIAPRTRDRAWPTVRVHADMTDAAAGFAVGTSWTGTLRPL